MESVLLFGWLEGCFPLKFEEFSWLRLISWSLFSCHDVPSCVDQCLSSPVKVHSCPEFVFECRASEFTDYGASLQNPVIYFSHFSSVSLVQWNLGGDAEYDDQL